MTARSTEQYKRRARIQEIVEKMLEAGRLPPGSDTEELRELVREKPRGRPPKRPAPTPK